MANWLLKRCPKCHGDLFAVEYMESYICLQCGYYLTKKELVESNVRKDLFGAAHRRNS